ncbi:MAG: hypothetical protein K0Q59_301 [Paenibacillus sp.]|jgi:hypothetical protein|nr:hypothetical protein [Paenibacillus sp.]
MNFYINNIKINSIANLGALNIGFNILSDNKAVTEEAGETTPPAAPVAGSPPRVLPSANSPQ